MFCGILISLKYFINECNVLKKLLKVSFRNTYHEDVYQGYENYVKRKIHCPFKWIQLNGNVKIG